MSQSQLHFRPWSPSFGQHAASGSSSGSNVEGSNHGSGHPRASVDPSDVDDDDEMTNVDEDEEQERDNDDGQDDDMTNIDSVSSVGSATNADSATNYEAVTNADTEGTVDDDISNDEDVYSTRTETVHSSILEHEFEGGRRYHSYRNGRYPLPNDDVEQLREELKHRVHLKLTGGKLFHAPICEFPQKIMDLCTGTGLWPIAAADEYPSAQVVGVDLSPIQPYMVPPNVQFILDDVEDVWLVDRQYDFIHMRFTAFYIRDMPKLLQNIYRHLRPGGWVEMADFGIRVLCDDDTMRSDWPFGAFARLGYQAYLDIGLRPDAPDEIGDEMLHAGFVNLDSVFKPAAIGEWPEEPEEKAIGAAFRDNLFELVGAAPKILLSQGLSETEIEVLLADVRKSLYDTDVHAYMMFKDFWGQKPEEEG